MRKFYLARNKLERNYLRLIALSLIIPTLIIGSCLYYIIFNLMAEQLGIPEVIAYHLIPVVKKVNMVLLISLPVIFVILITIGIFLTRRLIGPIERIESDLGNIISSNIIRKIKVRKGDALKQLVDNINAVLEKLAEKK